jgi:hypothetical protein
MAVAWGSHSVTEHYGSSHTVTMPSGIAAGNLLLLASASLSDVTSTQSGWTLIYRTTGEDVWGYVEGLLYWRIATGGETDLAMTTTEATSFSAAVIRITGASQISPIHASNSVGLSSPQNYIDCPALTPTVSDCGGFAVAHTYYEKPDGFSGSPYSSQFYSTWGAHEGNGYLGAAFGAAPAIGVSTGVKTFTMSSGSGAGVVGGHVLIAPPASAVLSGTGLVL